MWETITNWLTRRFSSPLPILFFFLGTLLILIEAIEIKFPDGTHVLRANEFSTWILGLGIALILAAALFQIFDKNSASAAYGRELGALEAKQYATLRELLHEYVALPGGLDFAACIYNGESHHDINSEQFAKRLVHFRIQHNLVKQTQYYLDLGKEMHSLVGQVNRRMENIHQGLLFRVVYDVEKGGIFYHQVSDNCYVVCATIDQSAMDDNSCDRQMRSMVRAVERHIATLENQ